MLLIVAIVFQSFGAIASVSDNHQTNAQHLQTEHSHADDKSHSSGADKSEQHDIDDCHHCGHCSGSHLTWVNVDLCANQVMPLAQERYSHKNLRLSQFIEASLRPPIA